MNDLAISIAMCTYNGAKHVLRPMESFAAQATARRHQRLGDYMREAEHRKARAKMRQVSGLARLPLIGREFAMGRYQSPSEGWKSMAVDLVY